MITMVIISKGDSIALAVVTPKHLQCALGLDLGLKVDCSNKINAGEVTETDYNFLFITALQKVAFFPFSLSVDKWRWEVLEGNLKESDYNKRWWELRMKYQGIEPPSPRNDTSYFDPAAKYHIVSNVEYIRYFISNILQFQFYEAMCKAAKEFNPDDPNSKPLYQCDFAGSLEAGKLLGSMLKIGFAEPWPYSLEAITGQREMSIKPFLNYFKPIFTLMKKELEANGEEACFGPHCK